MVAPILSVFTAGKKKKLAQEAARLEEKTALQNLEIAQENQQSEIDTLRANAEIAKLNAEQDAKNFEAAAVAAEDRGEEDARKQRFDGTSFDAQAESEKEATAGDVLDLTISNSEKISSDRASSGGRGLLISDGSIHVNALAVKARAELGRQRIAHEGRIRANRFTDQAIELRRAADITEETGRKSAAAHRVSAENARLGQAVAGANATKLVESRERVSTITAASKSNISDARRINVKTAKNQFTADVIGIAANTASTLATGGSFG